MSITSMVSARPESALDVRKHSSHALYSGNVKVAVRVRPLLAREAEAPILTSVNEKVCSITLKEPERLESKKHNHSKIGADGLKTFFYDQCLASPTDSDSDHAADQERVYAAIGKGFLDHTIQGYNTTIFAYGQTGSGKSYTMMGRGKDTSVRGIIPRTCQDLFARLESLSSSNFSYSVRLSYFEVYNEQVRDLLDAVTTKGTEKLNSRRAANLRVRESKIDGPYAEGLSQYVITSADQAVKYLEQGNLKRVTASTQMNDASSRSHAVFTLSVRQTISDTTNDSTEERMAHIRLVDLAGSERATTSGNTGERLREGSSINKSLSTLGRVISALISKKQVVPYRDSVLTWLLKESLGGNSKTAMIACISPSEYEETLSTLRYADQARQIRNKAKINHDIVTAADRDKLVEEMQNQINALQLSLHQQEQDESMRKELSSLTRAIRYYQDRAISEENKRKAVQAESAAIMRHNKLLSEHLRHINLAPGSNMVQPTEFVSIGRAMAQEYQGLKSRITQSHAHWANVLASA